LALQQLFDSHGGMVAQAGQGQMGQVTLLGWQAGALERPAQLILQIQ
jgi:hypothetical protein